MVGHGGSGTVWKCHQPRFDRYVAVKLVETRIDPHAEVLFARECVAMGALSWHPNIMAVYAGDTDESGRPYLIMPFVEDGSLADELDRKGRLDANRAAELVARIARALQVAHEAGVLHRDVKPENVLMNRLGEPQLSDFGIARVAGHLSTMTGAQRATPVHAAPEVLNGGAASVRSDVYSLASSLYRLIAGQPAFYRHDEDNVFPLLLRLATQEPPPLAAIGVQISRQLSHAVQQGMAKDPQDRPASAAEFADLLEKAIRASVHAGHHEDRLGPVAAQQDGAFTGRTGVATREVRPTPPLQAEVRRTEAGEVHEPSQSQSNRPVYETGGYAPGSARRTDDNEAGATRRPLVKRPDKTSGRRPRRIVPLLVALLLPVVAGAVLSARISDPDKATTIRVPSVEPRNSTPTSPSPMLPLPPWSGASISPAGVPARTLDDYRRRDRKFESSPTSCLLLFPAKYDGRVRSALTGSGAWAMAWDVPGELGSDGKGRAAYLVIGPAEDVSNVSGKLMRFSDGSYLDYDSAEEPEERARRRAAGVREAPVSGVLVISGSNCHYYIDAPSSKKLEAFVMQLRRVQGV